MREKLNAIVSIVPNFMSLINNSSTGVLLLSTPWTIKKKFDCLSLVIHMIVQHSFMCMTGHYLYRFIYRYILRLNILCRSTSF